MVFGINAIVRILPCPYVTGRTIHRSSLGCPSLSRVSAVSWNAKIDMRQCRATFLSPRTKWRSNLGVKGGESESMIYTPTAGMPGKRGFVSCLPATVGVANRFPSSISATVSSCIRGYSMPNISSVPASAMNLAKFRAFTVPSGSMIISPAMSAES